MSLLIAFVIMAAVVAPLVGWAFYEDRRRRRVRDAQGIGEEEVA